MVILDTMEHIQEGKFPIVLMSPEAYFSGSWRGLLTSSPYQKFVQSIVIDECHCVEQW
jgi:superfamily II DNA helicase RecQ